VISNDAKPAVFTVVISEKGGAERREFFDRAELSVGRVQGNDLMLPKGNVSKRHARLLYRDGRFIVTDLNSTNGTYVNRRRISQATIVREGDRIYIGDFILRIELGDEGDNPLSENTGSGPVLSAASSARASAAPVQQLADLSMSGMEDSSPSYPRVPGPPKMPSGARVELPSDAHSSGRIAIAEAVRPSLVDRLLSSTHDERTDEETLGRRRALVLLVGRVKDSLGLGAVPEEVDSELERRIERAVDEQLGTLLGSTEFEPYKVNEALGRAAKAELLDLGPLTGLLEDGTVAEIAVCRFEQVLVQRDERVTPAEFGLSSDSALNLVIRRLCRRAGSAVGAREVIVERRLSDGARLSALIGHAAPTGSLLVVRKPRKVSLSLEDLVRRGTISRAIANFIHQCMAARTNVLVIGPDTSAVAALLSGLCGAGGDGRVVAIQQLEDVSLQSSAVTRLSMPETFEEALRVLRLATSVPAARLLVELANREITTALIEIIGEGGSGITAALRAPNLQRALARLPADIVATRPSMSTDAAREWLASSFDIAIEISRLRDGRERVLRVCEITGASEREIQTQDIFTFVIERTAAGGSIEGTFSSSGVVPRLAEELRARGITLETSLFTRPPSR
jgi:pilus assembly protein CpaF